MEPEHLLFQALRRIFYMLFNFSIKVVYKSELYLPHEKDGGINKIL